MSDREGHDFELKGMSADTEAGADCFARLIARWRCFLTHYVRGRGLSIEDAEDVEQQVVRKLLARRLHLSFDSTSAWLSYLKSVADTCVIDYWKSKKETQPFDDETMGEIPDEDQPTVEILLDVIEEQQLLLLADELWLGTDPSLSAAERNYRLLAAQYFFLHGLAWEEVIRMVGYGNLTRELLDDWCGRWQVQRQAAYKSLHHNGDELAACLLGLHTCRPDVLDALLANAKSADPQGVPPKSWTWVQVHVIILRFGKNMKRDNVMAQCGAKLTIEEFSETVDRCVAVMPFVPIVETFRSSLAAASCDLRKPFEEPLWKRLGFQYRYIDRLPVKDVQDRTEPAGRVAEVNLNFGVLNMWLSGGRLLRELAKHRGKRNG